jgi:hypothetical protein
MKTINNNIETFKLFASRFTYDPETGKFTNNSTGFSDYKPDTHGYIGLGSSNKGTRIDIQCHRLAWFIYYGEMPPSVVDHINGNRADNRISNLQLLSTRANVAKGYKANEGTSSQYTGVSWHKASNKWRAEIRINGKSKHLGIFNNQFLAACAYANAYANL